MRIVWNHQHKKAKKVMNSDMQNTTTRLIYGTQEDNYTCNGKKPSGSSFILYQWILQWSFCLPNFSLHDDGLPFGQLKDNLKVTKWHSYAVQSPFQTFHLTYSWLKDKASSCEISLRSFFMILLLKYVTYRYKLLCTNC